MHGGLPTDILPAPLCCLLCLASHSPHCHIFHPMIMLPIDPHFSSTCPVSTCSQVLSVFGVQSGLPRGSLGFGLWLQLMCCTYLLTLSKYFRWGQTFRLWAKSETSLHRGEHRQVMKLEVWPLELALGVDTQDSEGKVS